MTTFLLRRLAYYVVILLIAIAFTYLLASVSLSPRGYFQGLQPPPDPAQVDAQLTVIGLNDKTPIAARFWQWFSGLFRGDLGRTIHNTSVGEEFGRRLGVSVRLLVVGTLIGTAAGVLLGLVNAVRQYRFSDRLSAVGSLLILATPTFVLATVIKTLVRQLNDAAGERVISYTGEATPNFEGSWLEVLGDRLNHLIAPTVVLTLLGLASYSRYQRNVMLDVLSQDFLRTARAKGLSRRRTFLRHALRVALIPMSTYFAFGFLGMFTGAIFTELIFGWHGMGEWFVDSINNNDVNSVVAVTLFSAVTVLLAGLLADIVLSMLDPRVRHREARR